MSLLLLWLLLLLLLNHSTTLRSLNAVSVTTVRCTANSIAPRSCFSTSITKQVCVICPILRWGKSICGPLRRLVIRKPYHLLRRSTASQTAMFTDMDFEKVKVGMWLRWCGAGGRNGWEGRKEEVFYLTTHSTHFILRLYGVGHMVKDHSDSEKQNPLPPHGLLFPINSKGSFICTIPQTG